ncbi:hypothetical protein [Pararhizobium sp. IMCC21322]|uniref:hypothetical protein n=1 Tax=Pararhizobium sp. IMCC21322 TaxID=3067903 RepID=UPI00274117D3|nr:hypothetical protein [Pararhizobium sp. IMCC21322]
MNSRLKTAICAAALCFSGAAANAANIVEIAVGDERFSTLVAAVQAAGLAETLKVPFRTRVGTSIEFRLHFCDMHYQVPSIKFYFMEERMISAISS